MAARHRKSGRDWLEQLSDPDETVAHRATLFLGGVGPSDAWMLDDLVAGTWVDDDRTRFYATMAIKRLGLEAIPAADRIAELLDDPYPAVRSSAIEALMTVAPTSATVVRLTHLAEDDARTDVQREAIRTLGRVPDDLRGEVIEALVGFLDHSVASREANISLKVLLLHGTVPPEVDRERLVGALRRRASGGDAHAATALEAIEKPVE